MDHINTLILSKPEHNQRNESIIPKSDDKSKVSELESKKANENKNEDKIESVLKKENANEERKSQDITNENNIGFDFGIKDLDLLDQPGDGIFNRLVPGLDAITFIKEKNESYAKECEFEQIRKLN